MKRWLKSRCAVSGNSCFRELQRSVCSIREQRKPKKQLFAARHSRDLRAFTLIELSLVLLVISVLSAAALRYATARNDATNTAALNDTMNVIEAALMNYRTAYNRLPCPADITLAENRSETLNSVNYYFGSEVDTNANGPGSGACAGANIMSGTIFAAGSVPTRTLHIADKYAYDPWGRKIQYGVDIRITASNAFQIYPIYYIPPTFAFVINNSYGVQMTSTNPKVFPLYLLISFGKNGHGGFTRNINTVCTLSTCPVFNYGSTNVDEINNCNCTRSAVVSNTYSLIPPVFRQDTPNVINGGASNTMFDDVVRYKTRSQMATLKELQ